METYEQIEMSFTWSLPIAINKEVNWRWTITRGGGFVPYLFKIATKLFCSENREHPIRKH